MRPEEYPTPTAKMPKTATLERWLISEGMAKATDGCKVEPDGVCPHGHPSWLVRLGLI